MVKKEVFFTDNFFVREESTLFFRMAKSFQATNPYATYLLQTMKSL